VSRIPARSKRFFSTLTSKNNIERDVIFHAIGADVELHFPPAAHLKAQTFDEIIAAAHILRHLRGRGQPVTVIGHPAIDQNGRAFHGLTVRSFDVQNPRVHRADAIGSSSLLNETMNAPLFVMRVVSVFRSLAEVHSTRLRAFVPHHRVHKTRTENRHQHKEADEYQYRRNNGSDNNSFVLGVHEKPSFGWYL
jgi:hypothetical protein